MSTIRKRGAKWNVQIRRSGLPNLSRTFTLKTDAEKWSKTTEAALDRGDMVTASFPANTTLGNILQRFRSEVVPVKKSAPVERYIISGFLKHEIATLGLRALKPYHFAKYRDERLKRVTGSTVARELSVIHQALQVAIDEWGVGLPANPLSKVKSPALNKPRERRLKQGEYPQLLEGAKASLNPWLYPLVVLAVETAMRRGELLALRWEEVDFRACTCFLETSKNGEAREVPLSAKALHILRHLPCSFNGVVFPLSQTALRGLWRRTLKRAGIVDLRFHDLRHEATSRLFEKGFNVMEVAAITGHKDLKSLKRYTHLKARELAKRMG